MSDSVAWETANTVAKESPENRRFDQHRQRLAIYHEIDALCRSSRQLDALELGRNALGENVQQWVGVQGQLAAVELATLLGGDQLADVLTYRLGRQQPDHAEVILTRTLQRLGRSPVARLWLEFKDTELPTDDPLIQARWIGLKGRMLAGLNDFDRALELCGIAIRIAPDAPEPHLDQAHVLAASGQLQRAVAACRSAFEIAPRHGSTVLALTDYLLQFNQINEAFSRIGELVDHGQSGASRLQMAGMLIQRQRYNQATKVLEGIETFFPLADPLRGGRPKHGTVLATVCALRSDLAYHSGDLERSSKWAQLAGDDFYRSIAAQLATPTDDGKRVELNVPYTLQEQVSCTPATLTMLSSYWGIDVDHEKVVDQVCCNGSVPVKPRRWATDNGMLAREFRVTFEVAQQLIDAGIPFSVSTITPSGGHVQVVCGYDSRRGVLLIQDPASWCVSEILPAEMIDNQRAFGPRGLLLLPPDKASLLDAIDLPDADHYDQHHAIAVALENHDRESASTVVRDLQRTCSDHWMTRWACLNLARYDANVPLQLELTRQLLSEFPNNDVLWLWETDLMKLIDRPEQVIARLRLAVDKRRAPQSTRLSLLQLLHQDANRDECESLLRCVLRDTPNLSAGLVIEAARLWNRSRPDDALELYRLAATSGEVDQRYARDYLMTAKRMGCHKDALDVLRRRFEKHGRFNRSCGMTYALALEDALRTEDAVGVVHQAIEQRPQDAELICQAARFLGRTQSPQDGLKLLDSAATKLPQQAELRTRAILAEWDGRSTDALKCYLELATQYPLDVELSGTIAALFVDLRGHHDAIQYLSAMTDRFPHCRPLLASTVLQNKSAGRFFEAVEFVDRMLITSYDDGWCWRQRSELGGNCGWEDQSLEDAQRAVECDYGAPSLKVRADALVHAQRLQDAHDDYRQSIQLDCDYSPAIESWMLICDDDAERQQNLEFIFDQLVQQRTKGSGLTAYYGVASAVLDPAILTQQLQQICDICPTGATARLLLATHYTHFRQYGDAEQVLLKHEQQLGGCAEYWLQLGQLYDTQKQVERAILAYECGLGLHPKHSKLTCRLAACYRIAERDADARRVLERALRAAPDDPALMVAMAAAADEKTETMRLAKQAALRSPGSPDAWAFLLQTCLKQGKESTAVDLAWGMIKARPHDAQAHLRLAEMLHRDDQWEESLLVIADAMQLDRRCAAIHALFANRLFQRKYYDKALAACQSPEVDPADRQALDLLSARILYAMGQSQAACQKLREALHRDPTDLDNWIRLADWCDEQSILFWYDEAATALVGRGGHLAVSHGYYAATLVRQNRRERAVEHLQYALELDRKYERALQELMGLMIDNAQVSDAEEYLDSISTEIPLRMLAIGRLLIAAATDDVSDYLVTLECLPKDKPGVNDQEEIAAIASKYLNRDRFPNFASKLTNAITKRRANKAIGYTWAHVYTNAENFHVGLNLFLNLRPSAARNTAAAYFLSVLRATCDDEQPGGNAFAHAPTLAILKHMGRHVYKDAALWSNALWTLVGQDQSRLAGKLAKRFRRVRNRDVQQTVPAMSAGLYCRNLRLVAALLKDAEARGPDEMTEECRVIRCIYTVFKGGDDELEHACRMVNQNSLAEPFLRVSKLVAAGLQGIESADPAALIKVWKVEFVRENSDTDPVHQRIYQLLRGRIAMLRGEKREARKWYRGKIRD
ncbi:C39 family peptidase [Stieleria sp. TO1_6]|uniref:C39 family peptidase n=1 Tax=Stieleria tagensis TaxID=2956795 RepID=UPI00209B1889|nr:C39 family peptidase [Stieleria tagensis]MCO8122713.1 C39 family peptidase [Stieleria tagensis]